MAALTGILNQARPYILLVALLCGVVGAWALACEFVPVLAQVWRPRGSSQSLLIGGACLTIIAGGRA